VGRCCIGRSIRAALLFPLALSFGGNSDPAFDAVSFDKLFAKHGQTHFRWTSRAFSTGLSYHQRLRARVEIEIAGSEIARRCGKGRLLVLVQFEDSSGAAYQTHDDLPLNADKSTVVSRQDAFVKPGDYQISVALLFTGTGEHATNRQTLHIDPLSRDPFPEMWQDAPAVEFVPTVDAPEAWYLPDVTSPPAIQLQPRRPIHVELILNHPVDRPSGGRLVTDQSMRALIPSAKLISQLHPPQVSMNIAMLDLERRRASFESPDGQLDWPRFRAALAESDPYRIDVKDLLGRHNNVQFLVREIRSRIEALSKEACALLILSTPMSFGSGVDMTPISRIQSSCRVYYVRFYSLAEPFTFGLRGPRLLPSDALASTLKPIDPKIFDVNNAEEFRRALAAILEEITKI